MERIVALVEGHTEEYFVRSTYGNVIVQRPFGNGKKVSLDCIIEAINDAMESVGGGIRKVLILLDREGRNESAADIADLIHASVSTRCLGRSVYVGVTDRHIENWVLADESFIRIKFNVPNYSYHGDGTRGKPHLNQLLGNVSLGPRDRAQLIREASAVKGAQKSSSLERLIHMIDFDWHWAKR